ncbi:MAG TPA: hypothetical protein VG755_28370 [Nannocystaceae bacterium]|nr:hypothetical protein [Nannocystaceae bacterium]
MRRWVALTMLAGACREEVREVQLVFGATPMRVSDGLVCPVGDGYLIDELWSSGVASGCMVVDFVPTNGARGCRISELSIGCTDEPCAPDESRRVLLPLTGQPMNPAPKAIQSWIEHQVEGEVLFDDAPDMLAIVRATIVRQACEDVDELRFSCNDVVGCVFSCPVDIGTFSGDVVLELDSLNEMTCLRDVRVCASDRMFDRQRNFDQEWCDTDPLVP